MKPKPVLAGWPVALAMLLLIACQQNGLIDKGDAIVAATIIVALSFSVIFGARVTR